jgi:hypothetical protein
VCDGALLSSYVNVPENVIFENGGESMRLMIAEEVFQVKGSTSEKLFMKKV